ncbi:hypothetical protein C496_17157 [Natronorubrum tibetense GA33]|uniref:Uncharacterized protein n=1 Tax=Natronorubrum tibetense GA33 TaxID=1114856 RepID=L9VN08_9EURY|nr:hypothetical protein C496_17157 [Natronorubrum tibetense GA33]
MYLTTSVQKPLYFLLSFQRDYFSLAVTVLNLLYLTAQVVSIMRPLNIDEHIRINSHFVEIGSTLERYLVMSAVQRIHR